MMTFELQLGWSASSLVFANHGNEVIRKIDRGGIRSSFVFKGI